MEIVIASEHAEFNYKNISLKDIPEAGYKVTDLSSYNQTATS